jgi:hypothetical protein
MTSLPPKPTHNFFPLRFSPPPRLSPEERHAMIEMAAYLRAEKRGFVEGDPAEDWTAAEAEVDSRLTRVQQFTGMSG